MQEGNRSIKKFGKGSRTCRMCGTFNAMIQKYNLNLCRRCFRESAKSLGFNKFEWVDCLMPALNVLANLFSTIYNNELRRKKECIVIPSSKLVGEVLKVLQKNNYIGEFEFINDGRQGKFRIQLLGRINKCGVISPRFNVKKDEFPEWEKRYLPAVNTGIIIVTTPNGVMTHNEAMATIGGRLIGYVYWF